ncbi:MAG: CHAT domain-containing protein [Cyclobacteriaceae bacterium]
MRTTIAIVLCFFFWSSGFAQHQRSNPAKTIRKLYNSTDPDEVKKSIEQMTAQAQDKSKTSQYILFEMLLGDQYEKTGDYVKAEQNFVTAYEETKKHLNASSKHLAFYGAFQKTIYDPIDRLGFFYLKIGNVKKAEQLFNESLSLRETNFPERSIHRIHPLVGLGSLHYRKNDIEKAYEYFNRAIKGINRAMTTNFDQDELNRIFLTDLAEICLTLGKKKEALDYVNKLALASSGAGKFSSKVASRQEVARVFEMKSRYSLQEADFLKAQEYLDKANHYNPANVTTSDVNFKLIKTEALLRWAQGQADQAGESFQKLVKAYQHHIAYNFVAMSEYEKEQFYYSLKKDFDLFNAFVLDYSATQPEKLYEQMYDNLLNTKALLLNQTNRQKNRILQSGDQALITTLHEWENSKAKLAGQYYQKSSTTRIDSLERKIETLEKQLNQVSGLFENKEKPIEWTQVKNTLKPGDAAIEIVRINVVDKKKLGNTNPLTDSTVYLFLLLTTEAKTPQHFVVTNGDQLEKRFLPYYRNAIYSHTEDKLSYDQFWLPIRKQVAGIKKFYLSADGVYNQINLNTLLNTVTSQYLIDEINLVYLTNTGDLLRKRNLNPDMKAVLVGRPTYDFTESNIRVNEMKIYGQRNVISEELMTFKEQDFFDLPGTEIEVSQIESILQKRNLDVISFKGVEALEENVKAVRSPSILHIATHGFFVDDQASAISPMIRSGIVLAGVKNTENEKTEDGILTAYEATNLNLDGTNLVVLSACQTGLGEVRNGEGVYGLQRAIMVAGANNLLMSLWKVDDEATAFLMTSFYSVWEGQNNPDEFREIQIAMRKKYPHPFYWGAFVMLGN